MRLRNGGYHWIGRLPDRKVIILYADPVLSRTHTQVGPAFDSHVEAIRYCRKERINLASLEHAPTPRPDILPSTLSRNQSKVYHVLLGRADAEGYAKATYADLIREARLIGKSSLTPVMNSLYLKGMITRVEAGHGDDPTTFRVREPETKKAALRRGRPEEDE